VWQEVPRKKNDERPGFGTRVRGLRRVDGYTQQEVEEKRQVLQIPDAPIEREQLRASKE
jgi:hypothetical protein